MKSIPNKNKKNLISYSLILTLPFIRPSMAVKADIKTQSVKTEIISKLNLKTKKPFTVYLPYIALVAVGIIVIGGLSYVGYRYLSNTKYPIIFDLDSKGIVDARSENLKKVIDKHMKNKKNFMLISKITDNNYKFEYFNFNKNETNIKEYKANKAELDNIFKKTQKNDMNLSGVYSGDKETFEKITSLKPITNEIINTNDTNTPVIIEYPVVFDLESKGIMGNRNADLNKAIDDYIKIKKEFMLISKLKNKKNNYYEYRIEFFTFNENEIKIKEYEVEKNQLDVILKNTSKFDKNISGIYSGDKEIILKNISEYWYERVLVRNINYPIIFDFGDNDSLKEQELKKIVDEYIKNRKDFILITKIQKNDSKENNLIMMMKPEFSTEFKVDYFNFNQNQTFTKESIVNKLEIKTIFNIAFNDEITQSGKYFGNKQIFEKINDFPVIGDLIYEYKTVANAYLEAHKTKKQGSPEWYETLAEVKRCLANIYKGNWMKVYIAYLKAAEKYEAVYESIKDKESSDYKTNLAKYYELRAKAQESKCKAGHGAMKPNHDCANWVKEVNTIINCCSPYYAANKWKDLIGKNPSYDAYALANYKMNYAKFLQEKYENFKKDEIYKKWQEISEQAVEALKSSSYESYQASVQAIYQELLYNFGKSTNKQVADSYLQVANENSKIDDPLFKAFSIEAQLKSKLFLSKPVKCLI